MLSDKAVIEYMEIYRLEYGKDINIEAARKQATNLLKLIKLISTPSTPLNGLIIDKRGKYENN
ncbi:MAG: hypothetical protein PHD49_02550 [Candidatus Shapirobacteria bacterium]|nr:hypothetical protein [Candidatus Shapirobacteria bacterium]